MPQSFVLTHLIDQLFGGLLAAGFHAVGLPADKASAQAASVVSSFTIEVLVAAGLIAFFVSPCAHALRRKTRPGAAHRRIDS
jgi:hypothetical protein